MGVLGNRCGALEPRNSMAAMISVEALPSRDAMGVVGGFWRTLKV
jgi:hypothetical protein